jgi:hypothetical protein
VQADDKLTAFVELESAVQHAGRNQVASSRTESL